MTSDVIGVPLESVSTLTSPRVLVAPETFKKAPVSSGAGGRGGGGSRLEAGGEEQTNPSLDNCCLKYLITGGYKAPRGGGLRMTDVCATSLK